MSDSIPLEIQEEIIKLLPVKSLIRFRLVCKAWSSLIASSGFIKHYSGRHHLLVRRMDVDADYFSNNYEYVSFVDDHTFPQQKVSLTVPWLVQKLKSNRIIASSHGLLCFYSQYYDNGIKDIIVLWNISIRKAIAVVKPGFEHSHIYGGMYGIAIGFGVCRETNDPKIVKISFAYQCSKIRMDSANCITPGVEVFTLGTKVWRNSYGNRPRESIKFFSEGVVLNGVFYWLATDEDTLKRACKRMIISFDMTTENFEEVMLPDSFARMALGLFKLGESLVIAGFDGHEENMIYDVWMMGNGVPKSFTKLFTFKENEYAAFTGFRKTGEAVIKIMEQGDRNCGQLAVYDPYLKHIDSLGIDGIWCEFDAHVYKETLLLLDLPNHMVYNDI